jgi:hypothetical protein
MVGVPIAAGATPLPPTIAATGLMVTVVPSSAATMSVEGQASALAAATLCSQASTAM